MFYQRTVFLPKTCKLIMRVALKFDLGHARKSWLPRAQKGSHIRAHSSKPLRFSLAKRDRRQGYSSQVFFA